MNKRYSVILGLCACLNIFIAFTVLLFLAMSNPLPEQSVSIAKFAGYAFLSVNSFILFFAVSEFTD